jgi:large subunit ribosomal protein L13
MTSDHRSFMATKNTVVRSWYIVDAADKPLGRVASAVAMILMGKNKPTYTPHVDCGDFVVIINAEKVKLTGAKRENAKVYNYSGYPSGLRVRTYGEVLDKQPEYLIEKVVKGMLPKTRLKLWRKLKVYAGPNHPHAAQQPVAIDL